MLSPTEPLLIDYYARVLFVLRNRAMLLISVPDFYAIPMCQEKPQTLKILTKMSNLFTLLYLFCK